MEQRREQSYTVLPAATQKALYSQSEHLAACTQHHLEIAEKFDWAVKQRLKRDAELSRKSLRHLMSVAEGAQRIARLVKERSRIRAWLRGVAQVIRKTSKVASS
jgi:uncharacterized small protein (DUF1192 family)